MHDIFFFSVKLGFGYVTEFDENSLNKELINCRPWT